MKTITFVDFWGGFNPSTYFLKHLFYDYEYVSPDMYPDVCVYSIFGDTHRFVKAKKFVHYTGENTEPDPRADLNLTFRYDDSSRKNIRLPLWLLYCHYERHLNPIGVPGNPDYLVPIQSLFQPPVAEPRNEKSVLICSNEAKSSPRAYLKDMMKAEVFGKAFGGKLLPDGYAHKLFLMKEYGYNICPENTIAEGYTTEKLLHAFAAGCVPIYWGWLGDPGTHDFNLDSVAICEKEYDNNYILLYNSERAKKCRTILNLDAYQELTPDKIRMKIKEYI